MYASPAMTAAPKGPPADPLWVGERDAAALLGVSVRTLLNLRKRDGLPFVPVAARVLYRPTDLAAWVEGRRTAVVAAGAMHAAGPAAAAGVPR